MTPIAAAQRGPATDEAVYPDSDGMPMADNTKQLRWIVTLFGNLCAVFRDRADVFVAADNLWYPVKGDPKTRVAPDVYVAFGRPKGDRGSYKQWMEGDVPLTVVFEVLSPGNRAAEMAQKRDFYEKYGVEEYYVYDPDDNTLLVYRRSGDKLNRARAARSYVSRRLGVRFELTSPEMTVFGPDGERFLTFEEVQAARAAEGGRAERLATLSRKARRGQASAEEIAELERLEDETLERPRMTAKRAVVLLSGGLDSATALAVARRDGFVCHALSVAYGQRHAVELAAARRVAAALGAAEHREMALDLRAFGGSALTADVAVPVDRGDAEMASGIPVTYVPARNTVFLSLALAYAEVIGAFDLYLGVNSVDYSGYPDCRPEFLAAFRNVCDLATKAGVEGGRFEIHAPLIHLPKADIIRLGASLGVDYALTHSCYDPTAAGLACGRCDSCRIRAAGFAAAGVQDPTRYAD